MATGSKPEDLDSQATWPQPEDMEKNPEEIVSKPADEESAVNLRVGAIKETMKAEVDENKILSVTTLFAVSPPSKRLVRVKSRTDTRPKGMEQDTAPPKSVKSEALPAPSEMGKSEALPESQKLRRRSIPASANKSRSSAPATAPTAAAAAAPTAAAAAPTAAPTAAAAAAAAAAKAKPSHSIEVTSPQSAKQTANKEVPKSSPPQKHGTEIQESDVTEKPVTIKDDGDKKKSDGKTQKQEAKRVVIVQVIFYRLQDIDTAAEKFDAEIILNAKWPEPSFDNSKILPDRLLAKSEYSWSPELYIENTTNEPNVLEKTLTLRYGTSGKAFLIESTKLSGTFSEPMQLIDFPFDIQNMSLLIRTEKPCSEVHLTYSSEDPHIVRRSLYFQKQQFRVYMHVVTEDLTAVPYDEYGELKPVDELRVMCYVARNPVFYIINCYLMAFLLSFLGFVSFSADAKYTMQRNVLSFFLMLGAVSHKYTLISHIPKTAYMTHADRYCLATILYLCLLSIWHAILTLEEPERRNSLDWIGIIVFGGMLIIYNVGMWRIFLTTTYSNRTALAEEEKKYLSKLIVLRKERATIDKALSD